MAAHIGQKICKKKYIQNLNNHQKLFQASFTFGQFTSLGHRAQCEAHIISFGDDVNLLEKRFQAQLLPVQHYWPVLSSLVNHLWLTNGTFFPPF